jgi:RimJ/RimL family protein N-acetyltransferase
VLVLQTALTRLVLCQLQPEHAESYFALVQHNRQHLTHFGDFADEVAAPLKHWIDEFSTEQGSSVRLGLLLEGELIGRLDLIGVDPPKFGLGYWLDRYHIGCGYASAALAALITHAQGAHLATDLFAGVTHGNERSEALLIRHGFRQVERFDTYSRFHRAL